jgi:hypothetical protein
VKIRIIQDLFPFNTPQVPGFIFFVSVDGERIPLRSVTGGVLMIPTGDYTNH